MQYLLDTCVISDFIKGEPGTQSRITQTAPINITVFSITGKLGKQASSFDTLRNTLKDDFVLKFA